MSENEGYEDGGEGMKGLWKNGGWSGWTKQGILLIPIVFVVPSALAVYAKCSLAEDWKILPFFSILSIFSWKVSFSTINKLSLS